MSEMLGNRYFIARQFDKALINFSNAIKEEPENLKIKKKLVICNIQVGHVDQALNLFLEIIKKDPYLIINTDPYHDDCPCPEIIPGWESKDLNQEEQNEIGVVLGMLYLYCNLNKSIEYFQNYLNKEKNKQKIMSILKILTNLDAIKS